MRQGQGSMSRALREMPEDDKKQALMRSIKPYSFPQVKFILQEALEQETQVNQEHTPLGMGALPRLLVPCLVHLSRRCIRIAPIPQSLQGAVSAHVFFLWSVTISRRLQMMC